MDGHRDLASLFSLRACALGPLAALLISPTLDSQERLLGLHRHLERRLSPGEPFSRLPAPLLVRRTRQKMRALFPREPSPGGAPAPALAAEPAARPLFPERQARIARPARSAARVLENAGGAA